eukprot:3939635-Rhodomonas_salina.1
MQRTRLEAHVSKLLSDLEGLKRQNLQAYDGFNSLKIHIHAHTQTYDGFNVCSPSPLSLS